MLHVFFRQAMIFDKIVFRAFDNRFVIDEIEIFDFAGEKLTTINVNELTGSISDGHGGGDHGIMKSIIVSTLTVFSGSTVIEWCRLELM